MKVIVCLIICLSYFVSAKNDCMRGPSYWCQNGSTAKKCGVSKFCEVMTSKIKFQPKMVAPPVNVTLYYESMCPDCKETWAHQLFPTYQKLASTGILNIILVPYGNAKETQYGDKWVFTCQHGPAECTGNLIETCALHLYPDQSKHIPFIHCMEYYGPTARIGRYCAPLSGMDYGKIDSCVNSDLGNSLQHAMAAKTESLNPKHTWVPWFTLNGVHTKKIQDDLNGNMLQTVCNAFTGTKPTECMGFKKACYKE